MAVKKLIGAGEKGANLKNKEQETRLTRTLESSKSSLSSLDKKFDALKKVLTDLNKNVATLRNIEAIQLTADFVSRAKEKDGLRSHYAQSGQFLVESTSRNEAGLREVSKRITLLHSFMAGDSVKQTAHRLKLSSLEHTEAIKKQRSIGMKQMDLLQAFGISNIAGLKDKNYKNKKTGEVLTKAELKAYWDKVSHDEKTHMDRGNLKRLYKDKSNPRYEDMISNLMEEGKLTREDLADMKPEEMAEAHMKALKTTIAILDRGDNAPGSGGGGSGGDMMFDGPYLDDTLKAQQLTKVNSDKMVHTLLNIQHSLRTPGGKSKNIATTLELLLANSDKMVHMTMTMEKLAKDDMKAAEERRRESKGKAAKAAQLRAAAILARRKAITRNKNSGDANDGWGIGEVAGAVVGTGASVGVLKWGYDKFGNKLSTGAHKSAEKIAAEKAAKKASKQLAIKKAKEIAAKAAAAKAAEVLAKKAAEKAKKAAAVAAIEKAKRVAAKAIADKLLAKKVAEKLAAKKIKDAAVNKAALITAAKVGGKLLLRFIPGVGWALLAFDLYAYASSQGMIDESKGDQGDGGPIAKGLTKGDLDKLYKNIRAKIKPKSAIQLHKPNWDAINAGVNQVNTLEAVTKQKNAAVQPSIDGEGKGKSAAVINSGNTSNSGNSAVINNYGVDYAAGYMNSEKAFNDPFIYPKPMGPGY